MVNDLFPSVRRETVKTQHFTGNAQFLWEHLKLLRDARGPRGMFWTNIAHPKSAFNTWVSVCTHGVGKVSEVGKDKN